MLSAFTRSERWLAGDSPLRLSFCKWIAVLYRSENRMKSAESMYRRAFADFCGCPRRITFQHQNLSG